MLLSYGNSDEEPNKTNRATSLFKRRKRKWPKNNAAANIAILPVNSTYLRKVTLLLIILIHPDCRTLDICMTTFLWKKLSGIGQVYRGTRKKINRTVAEVRIGCRINLKELSSLNLWSTLEGTSQNFEEGCFSICVGKHFQVRSRFQSFLEFCEQIIKMKTKLCKLRLYQMNITCWNSLF